jgi:yeast amino acid transporter
MATLGEMTALFPVKGPIFEFARRFLDESIGMATAWMSWFYYVVAMAAEIVAITQIFCFRVPPSYLAEVGYPRPSLQWDFGLTTDASVWVGIFLVVVLLINLLPVRAYGQIEYVVGTIKICMLAALILINTILNARRTLHPERFWTYNDPYGFSSANFTVPGHAPTDTDPGIVLTGSTGTFVALWQACVSCFYSMIGWEAILLTAQENRDLAREETIKIAGRKISLRILLLYSLAVFTVSLNVPYTDPLITTHSVFVLAAVRERVVGLPQFLQGFFVFSACSSAVNALYSASRLLHAAASLRDAWPGWGWAESVRSRLERTVCGVPMNAVFVSWLVGFLSFMSVKSDSSKVSDGCFGPFLEGVSAREECD